MGTRSCIAIRQGDGWKGRYCHWDGYPSGVGEELFKIQKRLGTEQMVKALTEDHYSWSQIDSATEAGEGQVEGVGRYHSDVGPDEWITHDGDNWGTEWCYVLAESGVTVLEAVREGGHAMGAFGFNAGAEWTAREFISWSDPEAETKMSALG